MNSDNGEFGNLRILIAVLGGIFGVYFKGIAVSNVVIMGIFVFAFYKVIPTLPSKWQMLGVVGWVLILAFYCLL